MGTINDGSREAEKVMKRRSAQEGILEEGEMKGVAHALGAAKQSVTLDASLANRGSVTAATGETRRRPKGKNGGTKERQKAGRLTR
jgi:hypothetical protein